MPEIGEIRRGKEIGYKSRYSVIWSACCNCGRERWVGYKANERKPRFLFCPQCAYKRRPIIERFWAKVQIIENECWQWQGCKTSAGYGQLSTDRPNHALYAHRFAYEFFNNTHIPENLELDHLCRNLYCVNPAHLEVVTHRENLLRGIGISAQNAKKTHCPKGHPYDAFNTYSRPSRPNYRECRRCRTLRKHKGKVVN